MNEHDLRASEGRPFTIAVDFDGTICEEEWKLIGTPVPHALESLRELQDAGCRLILWTCRNNYEAHKIADWIRSQGVDLFGVNENPEEPSWSGSPKAYANVYVDDKAVGCPLVHPEGRRPYVDWLIVLPDLQRRLAEYLTA